MIDQPPGRRHDHVHSAAQLLLLRLERNATVDGCNRHRSISRVLPEARFHLNTQFARRRENEHSRSARTAGKSLDDWERKGSSLSRSRLGQAHDVAAPQNERNCLQLNGRRLGIAGIANRAEHLGAESKRLKSDARLARFCFDCGCCH